MKVIEMVSLNWQKTLEKKSDNLKKIKRVFYHIGIFCGILLAQLIVSSLINLEIEENLDKKHMHKDDFSCVFQVDSIEQKGKRLIITGWAFELNKDTEKDDMDILLYDLDSQKIIYSKMSCELREDVNNYFLCEYDYTNSGFIASFDMKKINIKQGNYEILVRQNKKKSVYSSSIFLSKGELVYTNPKEYIPLDIKGTDIEKIVEEGFLRVYRPDYGIYVYQYEEKLYLIADDTYNFEDNENTYLTVNLRTTQVNRLPEARLKQGLYFDNFGFGFENNELTEMHTGRYRVSCLEFLKEYSISNIEIGYYNDGWIWRQRFRPFYNLQK